MAWFRAAFIAALFLSHTALPAISQDVTLTSPDGAVEITGTLLGFDGEFYRVDSDFGQLTVDGSGVLCEGPGCPNLSAYVAEVAFSGSSSMAEVLLPALIEGFAMRNGFRTTRQTPDESHFVYTLLAGEPERTVARFSFRVTNTDEGFADLLAGEADIVMALREIRPAERARAREAGLGDMTDEPRSRVLALDAMIPVVSPGNPLWAISPAMLAKVLAGRITNWAELGGPDAPISVHLPDAGFGLAQAIEDQLMRPAGLTLASDITRHDRSSALARAVVADPFAIGIASYAETGTAQALTLTGTCGFSLAANRRTIKTEDYPLTSPMFLYLPARRLPKLAREFLSYTNGPAAQIVIRRSGFVDQSPEELPVNAQGDRFVNAISAAGREIALERLQDMVSTLRPMARLTISFRFETGSSRLDAQSRSNVAQLAGAIESGVYDARRILFVGFSDGQGSAGSNERIALSRAKAVRDSVLKSAQTAQPLRVEVDIAGFGEALPMACDDSEWGRKVNRRVEVWIR